MRENHKSCLRSYAFTMTTFPTASNIVKVARTVARHVLCHGHVEIHAVHVAVDTKELEPVAVIAFSVPFLTYQATAVVPAGAICKQIAGVWTHQSSTLSVLGAARFAADDVLQLSLGLWPSMTPVSKAPPPPAPEPGCQKVAPLPTGPPKGERAVCCGCRRLPLLLSPPPPVFADGDDRPACGGPGGDLLPFDASPWCCCVGDMRNCCCDGSPNPPFCCAW